MDLNFSLHPRQLFLASRIALVVTAMSFAFRAGLEGTWEQHYHLSKEEIGWIFSPAFWGFTLAMIFGGPLCDLLGMKKLVGLAFVGHISGILIYLFAKNAGMLFAGTLCIGIGNGMVEAACNPLVVSLFPDNKTTMLNRFHVWFPGGIALGGCVTWLMINTLNLDWHYLVALLFLPVLVYGWLFLRLDFPKTERVTSGVSTKKMFTSCLNPLFIFMIIAMFLTSATELGTGTWIQALLEGANVSGILILVFINGIMAVGRSFAGPIVHRLNPTGMLIFSALFSGIGLILLAHSSGYTAFASAFVFAAGICFFWPTMLGFVSENLPDTGALGLSLMGGAGMLSVSFVIPAMGKLYDTASLSAVNRGLTAAQANAYAGSSTLQTVALMPAIVFCFFLLLYFTKRAVGAISGDRASS